ncbi:MAG: NAD(+) synthase [Pseudomonadales bacterium]|nr:NAD(+) synthase [Pseudomonadales bacterium]
MLASDFGYIRVAACAPALNLANPKENAKRICAQTDHLSAQAVSLILYPELCLTGYTCEDLFFTSQLQIDVKTALLYLATHSRNTKSVIVVGAPLLINDGRLLNCAFVISNGKIQGAVPKTDQPNHGEFYDRRWFVSGAGIDISIDNELGQFQLSTNQLFEIGDTRFAIEICEDLWAPQPIGTTHALAGAELILNPSASPDVIAKADYRRDLVRMASAQRICAYLYASSGPLESSKDLVFGGHLIASENGHQLRENQRFSFGTNSIITEFDWQQLRKDRSQNSSFSQADRPNNYRSVSTSIDILDISELSRTYSAHPFVPNDEHEVSARALEILSIQAAGLARRMLSGNFQNLVIGVSGGLDSTLAFLVCLDTIKKLKLPVSSIVALTLPGPGTSTHTLKSARDLATATTVTLKEINIHTAVSQHLADIEQPESVYDRVYENAQARERTQILFDYANKVNGVVVGTGDMSELALGWCTFNADQMSSYNVNAGIPKTLISYLMRWYAEHRASPKLAQVLLRVIKTPISPELLPTTKSAHPTSSNNTDVETDSGISHKTEEIIGPYELHDFFLFHYVRNGFSPKKIYFLATHSFKDQYSEKVIKKWLMEFFRRFFSQQFKRTTLPAGPKIGSVSLSPRGDWRMPDEASASSLLSELESL